MIHTRTPVARQSFPPPASGGPPSPADIDVQSLSTSQWRVCDRRMPVHDACSLLGFIEEKAGRFEVMQIGSGFEWFDFDSLAEATAHFTDEPVKTSGGEHVLSWSRTHA